MYVRVKREKLCIFLLAEASESVLEIKSKLQRHLDKVISALRLFIPLSRIVSNYTSYPYRRIH